MKKTIKLMSLCLFVALGVSSCEPAEDDIREDPRELGGFAYLSDRISMFDKNEDLNIDLFTAEGVEVETVEILQNGEVVTEASISGESATFNASVFDTLEVGDEYPLRIRTTLSNGNVAEDPFTLTVADAIVVDEAPKSVRFMDSTTAVVAYSTFSQVAPIDNVSLFFKNGVEDEYSLIADDLDLAAGEFNLGEFDYEANNVSAGDTIYYRFVAESGEFSEEAVAVIPVLEQDFGTLATATINDKPATNSLDLSTGNYVDDAEAEILFENPYGFQTQQGINFVQAVVPAETTAEEFVEDLDLFEAEEIYESGSPTTSVQNVDAGDVFIYKVTRTNEDGEDMVYYGVIRIADKLLGDNAAEGFNLEYAEGTIIRE